MELMLKDRLTHHINDEVTTNAFMGDVLYQLARYEDTGFSVEELEYLREKKLKVDVSVPYVTAEISEEICLAENDAETRLMSLELEKKQDEWTSISERPPEEEGRYLVTDDAGGVKTVQDDEFLYREDGTPLWLYSQNVTAWRPLPEPYRGEQE